MAERGVGRAPDRDRLLSVRKDDVALVLSLIGVLLAAGLGPLASLVVAAFVVGVFVGIGTARRLVVPSEEGRR